jgi:hypothetical protein
MNFIGSKLGTYYVSGEKFQYKIDALKYASTVKKQVIWDFNWPVFHKQSKGPRVDISLSTLYKLRSQQLRDNYDYTILAYSGGADSHEILRSFVDNKIHLDEIWIDVPLSFVEKSGYVLSYSRAPSNMISEWYLVIEPELKQLQMTNPEIKIHVSDSAGKLELEDFEDTNNFGNQPQQYHMTKKNRYIHDYVQPMIESGKKVCVIMGIDKCLPTTTKTEYGFMFTDSACWVRQDYYEYFYWTPDMPELVVTQAHCIWDFLKNNIDLYKSKLLAQRADPTAWATRKHSFDDISKVATYFKWDSSKHQTDKQLHIHGNNYAHFYNKYSNHRFYESWKSNFAETIRQLDPAISFKDGVNASSDVRSFINIHMIGKHDGSYHPY